MYSGLSTDTKPTFTVDQLTGAQALININALFLELDTGKFYYFDGSAWQEVGA